jgi:hypothetical protein
MTLFGLERWVVFGFFDSDSDFRWLGVGRNRELKITLQLTGGVRCEKFVAFEGASTVALIAGKEWPLDNLLEANNTYLSS